MKFCLLLLCIIQSARAQVSESKIVAVGAAGVAKENMLVSYELCLHNSMMSKNLQALSEVTRNDFSFYGHVLNVQLQPMDAPLPLLTTINDRAKMKLSYWIHWKCKQSSFEVNAYSVLEQKLKFSKEWKNIADVNRSLVHQYNDLIYQSLFAKKSLFNAKIFRH